VQGKKSRVTWGRGLSPMVGKGLFLPSNYGKGLVGKEGGERAREGSVEGGRGGLPYREEKKKRTL